MDKQRLDLLFRLTLLVDVMTLSVAFAFSYYAAPFLARELVVGGPFVLESLPSYLWLLVVIIPAWIVVLHLSGAAMHSSESSPAITAWSVLKTGLISTGFVALYLYATKNPLSRVFIATDALFSTLFLLLERIAVGEVLAFRRRKGWSSRQILILGTDEHAAWAIRRIQSDPRRQLKVWGCLGDSDETTGTVEGVPIRGKVSDYRELVWQFPIEEILISPGVAELCDISPIVQHCEIVGLTTRIISDYRISDPRLWDRIKVEEFFGRPAMTIATASPPPGYLLLKRAIDAVVSAVLLAVLSPLFVTIAIAIKLTSSGSIFYRWRVMGKGIKPFTGYKFRTMVVNADTLKAQLVGFNEMSGPMFKMRNDPRITQLGRVLRKYSLDELPQLWSVLVGDMSLVGPRPPGPHEFERFEVWHRRKLSVKPGITCLWQVMGRNKIANFDDWVALDLQYIDNWSLWLDLKILAKTAVVVISGTGV